MSGRHRRKWEGGASAKAAGTLPHQCIVHWSVRSFFCSPWIPVLISARTKGFIRLWCDCLVLVSPPEAVSSWSPSGPGSCRCCTATRPGEEPPDGRAQLTRIPGPVETEVTSNLGCLAHDPLLLNPCHDAPVGLPSTARTFGTCVLRCLGMSC